MFIDIGLGNIYVFNFTLDSWSPREYTVIMEKNQL